MKDDRDADATTRTGVRRDAPRSRGNRTDAAAALAAVLAAVLAVSGCGSDPAAQDVPARFALEVSGEEFVVEVATDTQVAALNARLASGAPGVVLGSLAAGDGGFNAPWSWHMVPASVEVADFAIELCDGRPSMVEADLGYWLDTVRRFCPWGARVVRRIQ